MDAQELQDRQKVSTIWVNNLHKIVNKMNDTKSSMIDLKLKDAIKLDTVPLDKIYQKKAYYPKMDHIDIFINVANNMEIKKDVQQTLS